MIDYATLKAVHVGAVVLSGTVFAVRGAGRLVRPDAAWSRPTRVLPHAVDTVLLVSALALASFWLRDGLPMGWIGAKVAALVAYIGLGIVALRPRLARGRRMVALAAAMLTYGYIVGVALAKSPAGPLHGLAAWNLERRCA